MVSSDMMIDDFVSHVCMIVQPISPKFTFHLLLLVYYEVHVLASSLETEMHKIIKRKNGK
jgi:hypothetical protein